MLQNLENLKKSGLFPMPNPSVLRTFDAESLSSELSDVPSDIIIKSRIQYGGRLSACKGLLMEYSKSTTIHGIRYIFEVHRPLSEKLYWLGLLVISFCLAVALMKDTYLKWLDSPIILGFDETLVPVHKIPFPTVTVCPEIKTNRDILNFTEVSKQVWQDITENGVYTNAGNLTQDELEQFAATLQLCERDVIERFAGHIPRHIGQQDVADVLVQLSVSKNQTAPACKWTGRFYLCETLLNYVATDEGICYQFNGLQAHHIYRDVEQLSFYDPEVIDFNTFWDDLPRWNNVTGNWSLDRGYEGQGYNSYPQRTVFASARNGFFAFLQGFEHNFEYACRSFRQGYKVFLNSPESVPLTSGNYILVPHGDEVMVSVIPQYVVSSDNLHDYEPAKRQCYFNDERYLRYFRHYSQANCQTECLTNHTIAKCGCAKFWMPKPADTPVCELRDMPCSTQAQAELILLLQDQTVSAKKKNRTEKDRPMHCDCMPACTSLDYNVEISRARFDGAKTLRAFREEYEHSDFLGARLSVYFKEHQFTAIKRTVLFSVSTLIANCGGIFGLFMGISSLSIIELLYFFSVRLFGNLRKRRHTKNKLRLKMNGLDVSDEEPEQQNNAMNESRERSHKEKSVKWATTKGDDKRGA